MTDTNLSEADVRAIVKDVAGEMRADMDKAAKELNDSLVKQFGSVAAAKAAGAQTNVFAANGSDEDGNYKPRPKTFDSKSNLGRFVRAIGRQGLDGRKGTAAVKGALAEAKERGDTEMVNAIGRSIFEFQQKTLALSDFSAGGALVPEEFSSEVIPLLYDQTVVFELGAQRIPMPNGNLTMPFADTGVSASYVGEVQNIPVSEPTYGQIQMNAKKLAVVVPIANDLLRTPSASADAFVQRDIVNFFNQRVDLALLRDDGTSGKPKGLREWILDDTSRATNMTGTGTLAEKVGDLGGLIQRLQERKIPMIRPGFAFDIRTEWALKTQLDGNGQFVFAPQMDAGSLFGFPYKSTTAMPNNIGVGSNKAEVIFAAFGHFLVGDTETLEITVAPDGAYHNGSAVVSGLSTDTTPIRAIARHDCAARYRGQEGEILDEVDWAA